MFNIYLSDFNKKKSCSGIVAALGNFDGIHLGHINLLSEMNNIAVKSNYWRIIILFSPLTHEYFNHNNKKTRLSLLRDNVKIIQEKNLADEVVILHFNKYIAMMPGDQFISEIVIKKLNIQHIIIGKDFNFGYQKSGNIQTLEKHKIKYSIIAPVIIDNTVVSSSLIRQKIADKEFAQAIQYLGHNITYTSRVVYGTQLGRTAQVPTINLNIPHITPAIQGVFLSFVYIDGIRYNAISNIGTRPTVNHDLLSFKIEAHLLNANVNCYNKIATIEFISFVRPEKKFNSTNEMFMQIKNDIKYAQSYFDD